MLTLGFLLGHVLLELGIDFGTEGAQGLVL